MIFLFSSEILYVTLLIFIQNKFDLYFYFIFLVFFYYYYIWLYKLCIFDRSRLMDQCSHPEREPRHDRGSAEKIESLTN